MDAIKNKRLSFGRPIVEAARQAWRDLLSLRWANLGFSTLYWSSLAGIVTLLALMSFSTLPPTAVYNESGCRPDGSFSPTRDAFNWWAVSGFFDITISFGPLVFSAAKTIDVAWQLVVGRGGQALIGFFSWRVFADYIATKMVKSPITYATFWVIFLHQEPTVTSTYRLARDLFLYAGTDSPTANIFIVGTVAFALAFPTFMNSMTGYESHIDVPYIQVADGNMVPFQEFSEVAYVIHDGHRIALTDEYPVLYDAGYFEIKDNEDSHYTLDCTKYSDSSVSEQCSILGAVSNYVADYGFYGLLDEETNWMRKHENLTPDHIEVAYSALNETLLPAPALNISTYYLRGRKVYGDDWVDPRTGRRLFLDHDTSTFVYSEVAYSWGYIMKNGNCQPSPVELHQIYQWGYSFIQLFIMLVLLLIWSTGLGIMWLKAHRRLDLRDEPEVPRGWRAVVELSRAMERELASAGIDVTELTYSRAKKEICERLRGGTISVDPCLAKQEFGDWPAVRAWIWRDKWPLVVFCITWCASFVSLLWLWSISMWIILWYVSGGILVAARLGSTTGSKAIMLVVLGFVGGVAVVAALSPHFP